MRLALALGILSAAASPLPAQEQIAVGRPAAADATIRIEAGTGSLRVIGWQRDSIQVRGRVEAGAGRFFFAATPTALKLGVEAAPGHPAEGTADLEIQVPARSRLRIRSGDAEVEVTLAGGSVEVAGTGGRVRIEGRGESAIVETIDGNVELDLRSALGRVRTASGTIVVRGVVADLEATTVSGPLLVGMEGAVQRARLETTSSEIAFKGDLAPEGHLEAATHGGDVELRLPPRLEAAFHLVSYGGGLVNELVSPSAVRHGPRKGEWTFTTGNGRAVVEVKTFKGRISLKARGEPPPS